MMKFFANPDYMPGGVHNFWSRAPVGQDGQAVSVASAGDAGQPPSMLATFFMNPALLKEGNLQEKEVLGKVQEKEFNEVKSRGAINNGGGMGLFDRGMKLIAALPNNSMYNFQY